MFSNRSTIVLAAVAFIAGAVVTLAIRPPGSASPQVAAARSESGVVERIRWRVPLSAPRNLPGSGETPVWMAEAILAASGGAVRFDLYDPGELAPAFAIGDAVRDRKVQAGYTWLGYDQGKIPSSPLFGATPFGLDPWAYIGWWFFGDGETSGEDLALAIYAAHHTVPIFCGVSGPETAGWFREPLLTSDDLNGLKIRFAGLGGRVMERVGASITMLPAGEIFQALETGVIDATEFAQPVTDQALGFNRIAKYNYFPGWHQPFSASHLIVNIDVWNALAAADQALIRNNCTASVGRSLGLSEYLQGPVVAGFEDIGVTASYFSDELLQTLKNAAVAVLDEEAAKDADFKTVLESQRAFQKLNREWRRLAYLPKDFK